MFDWIAVAVIGILVGLGELVARYRDEPVRALRSPAALLYCAVNGGASVFALVALRTFGWSDGVGEEERLLTEILTAGLGAMAVFRTSLFQVRVGNSDIGVGPIAFLQIFLSAMDRAVDRQRAEERARKVLAIMGDLDFARIYASLPAFCLALMQNLPVEDATTIGTQVSALFDSKMENPAKVLTLGLTLMNFVGEDVLEAAVKTLREQLDLDEAPEPVKP